MFVILICTPSKQSLNILICIQKKVVLRMSYISSFIRITSDASISKRRRTAYGLLKAWHMPGAILDDCVSDLYPVVCSDKLRDGRLHHPVSSFPIHVLKCDKGAITVGIQSFFCSFCVHDLDYFIFPVTNCKSSQFNWSCIGTTTPGP